jgi:hypothetical protein
MENEIIKGQEYECIKTIKMRPSGDIAFVKGKIYKSEINGCLTNEQDDALHQIGNEFLKEHFKEVEKVKTEELIVGKIAYFWQSESDTMILCAKYGGQDRRGFYHNLYGLRWNFCSHQNPLENEDTK